MNVNFLYLTELSFTEFGKDLGILNFQFNIEKINYANRFDIFKIQSYLG